MKTPNSPPAYGGGLAPPSSPGTPAQRLAWAVGECQRGGLRLTSARRAVLELLAAAPAPLNFDALAHTDVLRDRCDATTVFRTLVLLSDAGVLRRLHLRSKASFFALNIPGERHDHLICRRCGTVHCLPGLAALDALARQLAGRFGYADVRPELDFHGLCPECHRNQPAVLPVTKLPIRISRSSGAKS